MTAYATEAGLILICPLTGLAYTPDWARVRLADGQRFVESKCRWCDSSGHTRQEAAFNPSTPQIHTHLLDQSE